MTRINLLEFKQELPVSTHLGEYFTEVLRASRKAGMKWTKNAGSGFGVERSREAVPCCSSAGATDGLERPLLVYWQDMRQ